MAIDVTFLRDVEHGGSTQQPLQVAQRLAAFIGAAQRSLHIAIYDFRLHEDGPLYALVVEAVRARAQAGVDIRIAYDAGKPNPAAAGGDPITPGTGDFLRGAFGDTAVQVKPVTDINPQHGDVRLMHNKYILRDGQTPAAKVWTGSANFTDDTWTFQENNLVQIASPELATYYETDFEELWKTGNLESTGINDRGTVTVGDATIDVAFSPGEGRFLDEEAASLIAGARRRIKVASMLISSRHILYALQDAIRSNQVAEFSGLYDITQMQQTIENWKSVPHNEPLIPIFEEVAAKLAHKVSIPYAPTSKHNFMHNKVLLCDDSVFMGSFNLSHSATMNAENALVIHSPAIAEQYSQYIDALVAHFA